VSIVLVGKREGNSHLQDLGIDRREWAGLNWFRIGQVAGCCEHGNEPSGSIKFDCLRIC
jgi:hypothetical protein